MCVIVDANAINEIFRVQPLTKEDNRPEAGKKFFDWLDSNPERLVIGGSKLQKELNIERFMDWAQGIERAGKLRKYDNGEVDQRAKELQAQNACESNDEHIIALAQISGARLLYSKDQDLRNDFKDLLNSPQGKVFPTGNTSENRKERNRLLADKRLCRKSP